MKRFAIAFSILLVLSMLLSACGAAATTAPAATTAAPAATEAATAAATEACVASASPAADYSAAATVAASLPRNETLYFGGLQWGTAVGWNPFSSDMNNSMAVVDGPSNASTRTTMFETLYMYNMLDGKQYPLLADGDPVWNADNTEVTVKLNPAAKWSDGTAVTADDVAYTFASAVKYSTTNGLAYKDYIDTITASDPQTVVIKAKLNADGKALNTLLIKAYLSNTYVIQKAWTQKLEARVCGDAAAFKADPANDVIGSGPYKPFFSDDQKLVLVRDDNYWGKDASMWGKLATPKYLAHTIYADNNATLTALKAGEIDVDQQFAANVQDLWLKDNLPISTYISEAPYSLTASIPTAYFNMKSYGLDNVAVRKAIAIAVDYDTIIANAMANQSPTFTQVPRSLMNPTAGEQAMYNHDDPAVKALQWAGNDIAGAKKLLDDAGIKDTDGDGWRELDGKKLSYKASCPNGWSDWQAAIEIVAAAGKKIGIDIQTYYPEWSVYQTVFTDANQTDLDIFMYSTNGAGPTNPWGRVRQLMSSEWNGTTGNWNGNYGGYSNPEADKIIAEIPQTTDEAKLKELYTDAVKIYLTDVPSFSLMYRPDLFHIVNESVWTGYPEQDDGKNIPPTDCINGYGMACIYNISLVSK